jgi:signal transduction histidine kinase
VPIIESWQKVKQAFSPAKLLVTLSLVFLIVLLFVGTKTLTGLSVKIRAQPLVFDVDPLIKSSKIYFGEPLCSKETTCFVKPEYDDSTWLDNRLGKTDFRLLSGFNKNGGQVIYRFAFTIPEELVVSKQPITFSVEAITLTNYRYFLNGTELFESGGESNISKAGAFSIPRSYLDATRNVQITILGRYIDTDRGIFQRLNNIIGDAESMGQGYIDFERASNTHSLVFFCIKLGIFAVFALLYLFSETQVFLKYFLGFAFFVGVDSILITDLLPKIFIFPLRASLLFNCQLLGFIFLWFLVETLVEEKNKYQRMILGLMFVTLNILLYLYISASGFIKLDQIFKIHIFFQAEILAVTVLVFVIKYLRGKNKIVADTPILHVTIIFIVYFIAFLIDNYVLNYIGYNHRHALDVVFFLAISYITFREFTANKIKLNIQQNLIKSQADDVAIGKSATRVAHDLRKPFSNFRIAVQALDSANFDKQLLAKMNSQILNSIEFAEDLIEEVLNIKRKSIVKLSAIMLTDLAKDIELLLAPALKSKNISFDFKLSFGGSIVGDKVKLISVLQNLINNAEEALCEIPNKKIWLYFSTFQNTLGQEKIKIIVGNNGPQIPAHIIKKLFKSNISHGKTNGTGIGLTSIKEILDHHHGDISVRNLPFNKGVEFEITIDFNSTTSIGNAGEKPQIDACLSLKEKQVPISQPSAKLTKVKKIAIVDDDELIHMTWRLIWPRQDIYTFTSPEYFLDVVQTDPSFLDTVDLVVTDLFFDKQSKLTGLDFAKNLTKLGFNKIILSSGSDKNTLALEDRYLFIDVLLKEILTKEEIYKRYVQ